MTRLGDTPKVGAVRAQFTRRRPRTFRQTLTRILAANVVAASVAAIALSMAQPTSAATGELDVPVAPDRSAVLMEAHDCWTGEAPADIGAFGPGHAVVTLPGQAARYVKADVGYGIWQDDAPGTLHGFCR